MRSRPQLIWATGFTFDFNLIRLPVSDSDGYPIQTRGDVLRFSLSYRDVEELLAERGVRADHVTVWRWVERYAPELQQSVTPAPQADER